MKEPTRRSEMTRSEQWKFVEPIGDADLRRTRKQMLRAALKAQAGTGNTQEQDAKALGFWDEFVNRDAS